MVKEIPRVLAIYDVDMPVKEARQAGRHSVML